MEIHVQIITQHNTCLRNTNMFVFDVAAAIAVAVAIATADVAAAIAVAVAIAIAVAIAVAVAVAIAHRSYTCITEMYAVCFALALLFLRTVPTKSQHLQLSIPKS